MKYFYCGSWDSGIIRESKPQDDLEKVMKDAKEEAEYLLESTLYGSCDVFCLDAEDNEKLIGGYEWDREKISVHRVRKYTDKEVRERIYYAKTFGY